MVAAGIAGGIVALLLSQGLFTLKPEARYLTGVLLTAVVMLVLFIPVVIYANKF